MSTIKVNTIDNEGGAVDFPNKLTVRGNAIERTYTSSGTEPSSPSEGDFWYDTGNSLLKHYINSEFKTISFVPPATWYGSRGLNVGGMSSNAIDYFDITSSGNASDFGNLTSSRRGMGAVSNATYGVFAGGYTSTNVNTIDYITVATTGDAADFGDMTAVTRDQMSVSNGNRACFGGGSTSGDANKIEYITLGVTSGNASDFGDLTVARSQLAATSDATYGVFSGGFDFNNAVNTIDRISIATTGNATDHGDLNKSGNALRFCGSTSGNAS